MSDEVIIPFPEQTNGERIVRVDNPADWESPYTPEQALGIVLLNNGVDPNLDRCLSLAKDLANSLKPMGFTIEFTGVEKIG